MDCLQEISHDEDEKTLAGIFQCAVHCFYKNKGDAAKTKRLLDLGIVDRAMKMLSRNNDRMLELAVSFVAELPCCSEGVIPGQYGMDLARDLIKLILIDNNGIRCNALFLISYFMQVDAQYTHYFFYKDGFVDSAIQLFATDHSAEVQVAALNVLKDLVRCKYREIVDLLYTKYKIVELLFGLLRSDTIGVVNEALEVLSFLLEFYDENGCSDSDSESDSDNPIVNYIVDKVGLSAIIDLQASSDDNVRDYANELMIVYFGAEIEDD